MSNEIAKYKILAGINSLIPVKMEIENQKFISTSISENDSENSDDDHKISILHKRIHKEEKRFPKRLEMEKNWLPITINGFALWVAANTELTSQLIQKLQLDISPKDILEYNHQKIDRKGHSHDDTSSNGSDSKDKQYKITSRKKLADVFMNAIGDDKRKLEIKACMRALLKEFFNHPEFFIKQTRASQQNKEYWVKNLDRLRNKVFDAIDFEPNSLVY